MPGAFLSLQEGICNNIAYVYVRFEPQSCYTVPPLSNELCNVLIVEPESRVFVAPPIPLENLLSVYIKKTIKACQ